MTTRYKFLRTGYKSDNGDHRWRVGKWYEFDGELELCESGFHCSRGIYQAFSYVQGEILAEVEVGGKHLAGNDKEVWQKMRVLRSWKWTKKDSVLFSIYTARLALKNWEKEYPDDDRPRKAIEAAEAYIKNPSSKNRLAARSAAWSARSAAGSAESAAGSAESAAGSAESAAGSARSAARSAAWSARSAARSAAWSARSAAGSAESAAGSARSAVYKKLDKYMKDCLPNLKKLSGHK